MHWEEEVWVSNWMDPLEGVDESCSAKAKENYNGMACSYDRWSSYEDPFVEEGISMLSIQPGQRCFELGYGTGRALKRMKEASALIAGVDVSERMQEIALALVPDADLRVDDFSTMEIPAAWLGSFDCVFASFVLELFERDRLSLILQRLSSLLKPGDGRIVLVAMSKQGGNAVAQALYNLAHRVIPGTVDCRPIWPGRLVAAEPTLTMEQSKVLPLYGLSVEIVFARRRNA